MFLSIITGFAFVVLLSMTVNGIVGFASNVIALPILSHFMDLTTAVTILAVIATVQGAVLAVQMRKHIIWKIALVMVAINIVGMPVGMYLVRALPEQQTKLILGLFVLFVAVRQIYYEYQTRATEEQYDGKVFNRNLFFVLLSGMVNGAFACGGPLTVIYLSKLRLPTEEYRATNFAFGVPAMAIPAIQKIAMHQYVGSLWPFLLAGGAMVALSVVFSNILIQRINRKQFQFLVNGALVLSGLLMVVQNL